MQRALDYAEALDVPFAHGSNGDAFLEQDRTGTGDVVEREIPLDAFPTPAEFRQRYGKANGVIPDDEPVVVTQDYDDDGAGRSPRYHPRVAINRTVDAIARGDDRILLVMATVLPARPGGASSSRA